MYYCKVGQGVYTEAKFVKNNIHSPVLLILDSQVPDYLHLLSGVQSGVEVAVIDAYQDGVEQITQILQQGSGWKQVHLISHGSPGCLYLGNTELSLTTIEKYKFYLQKWFQGFQSGGELFIYGCQVAAGDAGEEFLSQLHEILQIEIAASRTLTGNSALGGNWYLEARTSKIHPLAIFPSDVLASYPSILATYIVNSLGDNDDGNLGNGITTLREAINAANGNKNEAHLIRFELGSQPQTILLSSSLGIFGNITIDGGSAAKITLDGGNNNRHFYIGALQELTLENLTLINGKDQAGGSIFSDQNARLNVDHVTFKNNTAVMDGSGGSGVGGQFSVREFYASQIAPSKVIQPPH